jgi:hypothetical protein
MPWSIGLMYSFGIADGLQVDDGGFTNVDLYSVFLQDAVANQFQMHLTHRAQDGLATVNGEGL